MGEEKTLKEVMEENDRRDATTSLGGSAIMCGAVIVGTMVLVVVLAHLAIKFL